MKSESELQKLPYTDKETTDKFVKCTEKLQKKISMIYHEIISLFVEK